MLNGSGYDLASLNVFSKSITNLVGSHKGELLRSLPPKYGFTTSEFRGFIAINF